MAIVRKGARDLFRDDLNGRSCEIEKVDCSSRSDAFEGSIRQNSQGLSAEQIESVLKDVGELPEDAEEPEGDEPPF